MNRTFIGTLILIFLLLSGVCFGLHYYQPAFDRTTLMVANALMFVLSLIAGILIKQNLTDRPQAFVRGVYSATLLKLMVCMGALLTYVVLNRANLYKPTLFVMFGIYVVYTAFETGMTSKMAKQAK